MKEVKTFSLLDQLENHTMGKDLLVFYPDYPYMSHNKCDEPHQCGENPNYYHFEDFYTSHKGQSPTGFLSRLALHVSQ